MHAMKLEPELIKFGVLERTLNNGPGNATNLFKNLIVEDIGCALESALSSNRTTLELGQSSPLVHCKV